MRLMLLMVALTAADDPKRPYAGQEARAIKALSAEEVEALQTGQGMGLARAAELNHHPGPKHVLELAGELGLSEAQVAETRKIHERMHTEAVRLGGLVLEKEQALDRLFASSAADAASLASLAVEIGGLQGRLRAVHLRAHVEMRALLTPDQVRRYDQLRGYHQPGAHTHRH